MELLDDEYPDENEDDGDAGGGDDADEEEEDKIELDKLSLLIVLA